jgi:hypothetical protein
VYVDNFIVRAFGNPEFRSLVGGKINTFFRKSKFLSTPAGMSRPVYSDCRNSKIRAGTAPKGILFGISGQGETVEEAGEPARRFSRESAPPPGITPHGTPP